MKSKENLRIVYLGTPDFAVESLRALVENNYNVVGVVTMPDKPAGRGQQMQASPVKKYALEQNLPLLQPEKLKDSAFLSELKAWNADVQVVVAFRMLPEVVWNMPPFGTINVHASLLPHYRGAAPINHAIIHGERESGVTTFKLKHEIDTGNILLQKRIAIDKKETAGTLHDKLMFLGAEALLETINGLLDGSLSEKSQDQIASNASELKSAPKIHKDFCQIRWNQKAADIEGFIRGLSPYPGAYTYVKNAQGKKLLLKIFEANVREQKAGSPGELESQAQQLLVSCADFKLELTQVQLEGKKRMKTEELLRGFSVDKQML
jgi:methionyl-tRNA formyltransferase